MHRCLSLPELVLCIAENVMYTPRTSASGLGYFRDEPSMVAFARTCRAFLDPALSVLWFRQPGLDNLVKVLPTGTWTVMDDDEGATQLFVSYHTLSRDVSDPMPH